MSNNQEQNVSYLDAKIADAREDVAKAQAKLNKLLVEKENRDRLNTIEVGANIKFEYGRGDKRRTLEGTVIATGDDEKLGKLLAVQVGEGLDVQTHKIRAADVLFEDAE